MDHVHCLEFDSLEYHKILDASRWNCLLHQAFMATCLGSLSLPQWVNYLTYFLHEQPIPLNHWYLKNAVAPI